MVSIDSWRASSMKAQVLTTTRSALAGVVGGHQPVGEERADELVGVDLVLRAAQRLDVEALRHGSPAYRRALAAPPGADRGGSGGVGEARPGRGHVESTRSLPVPDRVMKAVRRSGPAEADVGGDGSPVGDVLDDLAVGRDDRDAAVDRACHADVAVAVDGQRVEQLEAGEAGQADASGRTGRPAPARPAPTTVRRNTRPVWVSAQ